MKNDNFLSETGDTNRYLGQKSLYYFAKTYFPHYCKLPFADFHKDTFNCLMEATVERNKMIAIAAPRGNAKSSMVSLFYAIWSICYGFDKCILIVSSTKDQAEKLLAHIKAELTTNQRLLKDFADVYGQPNPKWCATEIITKNGISVIVSSVGHAIRGVRHREFRPSLIILDDVETAESTRTGEGREKQYEWFTKIVMNQGSENTNIVVAGTVLHYDSLLARLISQEEFPNWDKRVHRSVIRWSDRQDLWDKLLAILHGRESYKDKTGPKAAQEMFQDNKEEMLKGTKVLWEAKESYYDLMLLRDSIGQASFDSEKLNEPRATDDVSLDPNKIIYWDANGMGDIELKESLNSRLMVLGACDPSVGKNSRSDYAAIITGYFDKTSKVLYVVDADIGRWEFEALVGRISEHHKTRRYSTFIYEANGSQAWLGDMAKKAAALVPMKPITNNLHKDDRIRKLMIRIEQGMVRLSKRHTELLRQLLQYPHAAHDDGPDALSMLIDLAEDLCGVDVEKMKEIFNRIKYPHSDNPRRIIGYGGRPFEDPFGLLSG